MIYQCKYCAKAAQNLFYLCGDQACTDAALTEMLLMIEERAVFRRLHDEQQRGDQLDAVHVDLNLTIDELRAERDDYRDKYQWMVNRACDEKLDGYRELGRRAADAESERDELRAEVEQLRRQWDDVQGSQRLE